MPPDLSITPVILAGGRGLRLRPLTADNRPKPFVKFFARHSLLQNTLLRVSKYAPPVIVTHERYAPMVFDDLREIGVIPETVLCEPEHQGTAAAITLAACHLAGRETLMLVTPVDHVLANPAEFHKAVEKAAVYAQNAPCLIGAQVRRPSTRYGYIRCEKNVDTDVRKLESFHEKAYSKTAAAYFQSGAYLWNTGVFLSTPGGFLSLIHKFQPAIHDYVQAGFNQGRLITLGAFGPDALTYQMAPDMPIDRAVMEHLETAGVVNLQTSWEDIGVWPAILASGLIRKTHDRAINSIKTKRHN